MTLFIKEILNLQNSDIEQALDKVFDWFDDLFLAKAFDKVDEVLNILPIDLLKTDIIVGVLTITSVWKSSLSKRNNFYNKSFTKISKELGFEEANFILKGFN